MFRFGVNTQYYTCKYLGDAYDDADWESTGSPTSLENVKNHEDSETHRQTDSPSTLSEQYVPMPVSPLSDTALFLRLLFPGPGGLLCQEDSWPGPHPGETLALEPATKKKNSLQFGLKQYPACG